MGIRLLLGALLYSQFSLAATISIIGFTDEEKAFVEKAVDWAWNRVISYRVEKCTFGVEPEEMVSAAVATMYKAAPPAGSLFRGQLHTLRKLADTGKFPSLVVKAYTRDDFSYGQGTIDVVKVYEGFSRGDFQVELNKFHLPKNRSIAGWGSVIAHEMAHNLSHVHPDPDEVGIEKAYDLKYLINAFQSCVNSDGGRIVDASTSLDGYTCHTHAVGPLS